jgi:acetoin utilization deacetylase AcuC-like enzyme
MRAYYSDHFVLPLPPGHRFPMVKYQLLRERVSTFPGLFLEEAPIASIEQLQLAHDSDYVERVLSGMLSPAEQREIGFPWTELMVERSRRSAGATIAACQTAWQEGISANLAGGTHHAYAYKGSGFCVFNDAAIASRAIQIQLQGVLGRKARIVIIDLDVHQGNGTASILKDDLSIFTLSLHGEKNFPFRKEASDLDIGLPDGCDDAYYLEALSRGLQEMEQLFDPDLVIYLAGADPHEGDRLGRLSLTLEGLKTRDEMVFSWAAFRHLPLAITMAGGYGVQIEQTVDVHVQTIKTAMGYAWV